MNTDRVLGGEDLSWLAPLPVSDEARRVYAHLLAGDDDEYQSLSWRRQHAGAVRELRDKGLVAEGPQGLLPRSASPVLNAVAVDLMSNLEETNHTMVGIERLLRLRSDPAASMSLIRGRVAVASEFNRLVREADEIVQAFDRGPYDTAVLNPEMTAATERGVRFETIVESTLVNDSERLDILLEGLELGETVRSCPRLPFRLVIVDHRRALMIIPHAGGMAFDALLVHESPLLAALQESFDLFWTGSVGFDPRSDVSIPVPLGRDIIGLLSLGLSDSAICRRLGISERTLQRRIRMLQDLYHCSTRFQLGVQAGAELLGIASPA